MVEVFALQVDLRATDLAAQPRGVIDRARPPDEMLELVAELGDEVVVVAVVLIGGAQFVERVDQGRAEFDPDLSADVVSTPGLDVIRY